MHPQMTVTKLIMLEMGTYSDTFQRPYVHHVDGQSMERLQHATDYGKNLTPGALGAVGNEIMSLDTTVGNMVRVVNGFDTPRLSFMMEVEFPGTGGFVQVEWLTGYTDHVGVRNTRSGAVFNRDMRLYFNNVMTGRRQNVRTAYGYTQSAVMKNAFQLINADYTPMVDNLHETPHLMRPRDVLTNISVQDAQALVGGDDLLDLRPTHGPERVAVSYRNNAIPGSYLSRVLDVWNTTMASESQIDSGSTFSHMAGKIAEPSITSMRSLGYLATISELRQGGSVTWGELVQADDSGNIEDRAVITLAESDRSRGALAQRGRYAAWHGNGYNTIIAAEMVQAVPSLMLSYMLTYCHFRASNCEPECFGRWKLKIVEADTFNEGDTQVKRQMMAFISDMENQLLQGLSKNGDIAMSVDGIFDVQGESIISISANGEPMEDYCAPSFCDGLSSAIRAPDERTLGNLATGFNRIFSSLEVDHGFDNNAYDPIDNSRGLGYRSGAGGRSSSRGSHIDLSSLITKRGGHENSGAL